METITREHDMDVSLDDATARSLAFYETVLKPLLEPQHNGQTVAIHAETRDYEVAPASGEAMRLMHQRHPQGFVLLHHIGSVMPDTGLLLRMRGARVMMP